MKKPPSRFAAWQEANQVRREGIIDEYLAYLSKTRVRTRNVTDLADLVARHIADREGEACNKATLLRNVRYKAKLLSYQAKHLESGTKAVSTRAVSDPTARALVATSQLEAGNVRRELERLHIYVKSLEEQLDEVQARRRPRVAEPGRTADGEVAAEMTDVEYRFVRTCQTLRTVLAHFNVVVELDTSAQAILDKSKRRDNVIAGKEIAGPFFEWLASQQGRRR